MPNSILENNDTFEIIGDCCDCDETCPYMVTVNKVVICKSWEEGDGDYEEKKNILKSTIINIIVDKMKELKKKRFILDTDITKYAASYMSVQFYYMERTKTIYIYYLLDPNHRFAGKPAAVELYEELNLAIKKILKANFGIKVEYVGPPDNAADIHHTCNTNVSNRAITTNTIAYWKGLNDRYEFITDKTYVIRDKYRAYINNGISDYTPIKNIVDELNEEYIFPRDNRLIPSAFSQYRTVYETVLNAYISGFPDEDVVRFHLLNLTDFSIKE